MDISCTTLVIFTNILSLYLYNCQILRLPRSIYEDYLLLLYFLIFHVLHLIALIVLKFVNNWVKKLATNRHDYYSNSIRTFIIVSNKSKFLINSMKHTSVRYTVYYRILIRIDYIIISFSVESLCLLASIVPAWQSSFVWMTLNKMRRKFP